jgi:signal transduction histidine kinase
MSPRKKAQAAFATAILFLFLSGFAGYLTIDRLLISEKWVIHTHEVREALGDVDSSLLRAGRARSGYVASGSNIDDEFLNQFEAAVSDVPRNLQHLRELTKDNPQQLELCARLEVAMSRRIAQLRESIRLKKEAPQNEARQADLVRESVPVSSEITAITGQMRETEQSLLDVREKASHRLVILTMVTLATAFILSLELFAVHYQLLTRELVAREQAEQAAREGEESLRRLTARLLQLQDAERRKFSRELHDSLGQYLVGAKMNLEMYWTLHKESLIAEAVQLLDQSIAETRTISHLLHPPLLDEAGLASATKWYLEGFAQRSGIEVVVDLPDDIGDLPQPIALALFRALQESLTNIHRHSGSIKADVALDLLPEHVVLKVRDYGKGIAPKSGRGFAPTGANSGVGLAGMRERMHELGGEVSIQRCSPGTLITVTVPLKGAIDPAQKSAAD